MKNIFPRTKVHQAFSLVEVLVVIAIIAILVSLVMPAFNNIEKMAKNMKQKAQFATIETGLEGFRNDFGDYPESKYNTPYPPFYGGAQKLGEALVGMDGRGVHKNTKFSTGEIGGSPTSFLYDDGTWDYSDTDVRDNLASRRGPYLELDTANAVNLQDLEFSGTDSVGLLTNPSMVLVDQFGKTKNSKTIKKAGMPILYWKAGSHTADYDSDGSVDSVVFRYNDCAEYIRLQNNASPWLGTSLFFYKAIQDPAYSGYRPHRDQSFILMSAGVDGQYGTPDDVFNFNTDE